MRKQTPKRGFTIVELVIVIAVIAILAAVLIPTFASLIKKANESVDIRLVREMNTILKADEAVKGKPAGVDAVRAILAENGIADFTPAMAEHAFAWDKEENVVVLINTTTQLGVFPKEYKDVPYEASWELLAGNVNVSIEDLGAANLDEALTKVKPGQTILLTSDQTLNTTLLTEDANIDLNGKTLTAPEGFDLDPHVNVVITNGNLTGKRVDLYAGAELTLNDVNWTTTSSAAFYPRGTASHITINGGTIIADTVITTSYSDGGSEHSLINISGATFGSAEAPCGVAFSVINSGDLTITDCTIYADEAAVISRASNTIIKNTVINYSRTEDYVDTYLTNHGSNDYGIFTPSGYAAMCWGSGSGGMAAPIVIGDFYVQHYTVDANCTIENVTVNKTNNTYPDVYLSQENYDVLAWDATNQKYSDTAVAGTEQIVKTTLTCDDSVSWAVNPGKNASYVDTLTGIYEKFADYAGYHSFAGNGIALMYVDNVFVNGVEQAPGSTSASPVPAN